jgi:hypothetical protein
VLLDTAVQTISNHTIDSSNAIAAAAITSGNVGAANGGTGINSSASNGFATVASGTWSVSKSVPSGTVIGATDTQTMTNKRIQPRVSTSATGNTTPTPNADTDDVYVATGMTVNMVFGAPTNTATDGQRLLIRIKGTAARTLGWNAIYRASTDLALPTTTITTKTMYLGFVYNSADTTWDLVAYLDNF